MSRRDLAERLEDVIVDVIERDDLDAFSNYLLSVSNALWEFDIGAITDEQFALRMEELKFKYIESR
jgi:hypothetical protein